MLLSMTSTPLSLRDNMKSFPERSVKILYLWNVMPVSSYLLIVVMTVERVAEIRHAKVYFEQ